jgi:hypothetical protein
MPALDSLIPGRGKSAGADSAAGIKELKEMTIDEIGAELLSFADSEALINDSLGGFEYQLTGTFLESKGIDEFEAPAAIKSKMRKALKTAERLLEERQSEEEGKRIDEFLSLSVETLADELFALAKKMSKPTRGEGVFLHHATRGFWQSKGWEEYGAPTEVQTRMREVERAAQDKIDEARAEETRQRLAREKEDLPGLVDACTEWAEGKGLSKITKQDLALFLLERKKELMAATSRELYLKVNMNLKSK